MPTEIACASDAVCRFLICHFLEGLPAPESDIRWTLSQAMASWLPFEKHYPEILQITDDLRAATGIAARKHCFFISTRNRSAYFIESQLDFCARVVYHINMINQ